MAVFDGAESATNYDAIYQYDALGWTKSIGFGGDTAWFANRFHCAGSGTVAAVSFYTPVPGRDLRGPRGGRRRRRGTAPAAASGSLPVGGYHTVKLDTPAGRDRRQRLRGGGRAHDAGVVAADPARTPLGAGRAARRAGPVLRERRRGRVDGSHDASGVRLQQRLPQGVRQRRRARRHAGAGGEAVGTLRRRRAGWRACAGPSATGRSRAPAPSSSSKLHDAHGLVIASQRIPAVAVGEAGVWRFRCWAPAGVYRLTARAYDVAGHAQPRASSAVLRVTGAAPAVAAARARALLSRGMHGSLSRLRRRTARPGGARSASRSRLGTIRCGPPRRRRAEASTRMPQARRTGLSACPEDHCSSST